MMAGLTSSLRAGKASLFTPERGIQPNRLLLSGFGLRDFIMEDGAIRLRKSSRGTSTGMGRQISLFTMRIMQPCTRRLEIRKNRSNGWHSGTRRLTRMVGLLADL